MPLRIDVHHHLEQPLAPDIIQRLVAIDGKVTQLIMDNAQAVALLGEINDTTNQLEANLEDAGHDIDTLIAIANALPEVNAELANGLSVLKARLAATASRAGAIASAYPAVVTPPEATPGADPIPGDEPIV